jgi:bifunctional pyridoxal-dependent enzyme with beta-cystathionase and maltose regulon repressor activities
LNQAFHSCQPITANDIFVTPGLASGIDALAWCICNDGDGILIPQPLYNGFRVDLLNRSNAHVVPVPYTGVDGYSSLDDLFRPDVNRKALKAAFERAQDSGITVRALLISKLVLTVHLALAVNLSEATDNSQYPALITRWEDAMSVL